MAYQAYPYQSNPAPSYGPPPTSLAPTHGYHPPAPPAAHHYQLGPPVDPFRSYYADRLKELTFNSRPLIQELSILAMQMRDQNQWGNMTAVVEEIEGAVYRSPAHEKLPKLYLLDSISKNVGPPYTTHLLQQMVPRLYIRTHREVDGVTRVKMEEMISLWRRSGPEGSELYGPAAREAVEREIFGGVGQRMHPGLPGPPVPARDVVTRDSVLAAIHATIGVKQGEAAQRAWDRSVQTQLTALMGLSEMLNTRHVQPAELQQIMDQLRGMGYSGQQSMGPPGGYSRPALPPFPPTPTLAQQYPPPNPAPALPPFAPTLHNSSYDQPPHSMPPFPSSSTPTPAPAPMPATPLFDANMLSILNSLTGSGVSSTPRTPDLAPATVKPKERTRLDDYEDMVLSLNLSLGNLDMNRMNALPLEHLPIQCSQCAARFPSEGDQLNAHMDWHARRNKDERNSSGRGAHRRWLPRAEEWVNDIPIAGSSTAPDTIAGTLGANSSSGTAAVGGGANRSPAKPVKTTEELQQKWVRVPTGPAGAAAAVCPVCKEGFKREWSESEEEWVWRNAIDINGKIMHATCRQQQLTANRLARVAKGRGGSAGTTSKSPGMTPDPEAPGAKAEPHPLSVEITAGSGSGSTAASEGPVGAEVGADPEGVIAEKVEVKPELVEEVVPIEIEVPGLSGPVVDGNPGGAEGENVGSGKRKAEEDAEEERKRVKMEVQVVGEVGRAEEEVPVVNSEAMTGDVVSEEVASS